MLPLGGRNLDVLLALFDQRGRTVERDALIRSAWPGRVVEEDSLEIQVATLRRLLGAQAIVTVRGRGYRWVLAPDAESEGASDALRVLVGRQALLANITAALASPALRALTLHGPGGVGQDAAGRCGAGRGCSRGPNAGRGAWSAGRGAWCVGRGAGSAATARVALTTLHDVAAVPDAVAHALGLQPVGPAPLARWRRASRSALRATCRVLRAASRCSGPQPGTGRARQSRSMRLSVQASTPPEFVGRPLMAPPASLTT